MRTEEPRPLAVVGRRRGIQISEQRRLGVDDDAAAAGKPHDHIGTHATHIALAVFRLRRNLHVEVAVLHHARELDDPLQLHLTPPAAHVRRAERRGELLGLIAQPVARRRDEIEPRGERAELGRTLAIEGRQAGVVSLELGAERGEQIGQPTGRIVAIGSA